MNKRYYLWGAGGVGQRALQYLLPLNILDGIIDGDAAKHGRIIHGLKVYSYDEAKPYLKEAGVIIAHFDPKETERILDRDNVRHWRIAEFVTMWFRTQRHQNAVGFLDFPITTRCSLNCVHCMQYIPCRVSQDVPLDALKRGLDALFRNVGFVGEVSIIGGEPFLHTQLRELLEYIGESCRERIGSLVITTNGTVTPDSRILELCRELDIFISVSDYSKTLPDLGDSISSLEAAAREAGIRIERKRWSWVNPGRFDAAVEFEDCTLNHMQLLGGKLWRCTLMAAGHAAGFCEAYAGHDYYDLSQENRDAMQAFISGNNLPRRTSQCENCLYQSGAVIPSAVQNLRGRNHAKQ